ncbi:MAG: hypothetical protein DMG21_05990, partial [Acidobacteria bacterium]
DESPASSTASPHPGAAAKVGTPPKTARFLGVIFRTLQRGLEKFGIERPTSGSFRREPSSAMRADEHRNLTFAAGRFRPSHLLERSRSNRRGSIQ